MNGIGRFAKNIFESIADAGENFLDFTGLRGTPPQKLINLSEDLISHKGVASGIALARVVVNRYQSLNDKQKLAFFKDLKKSILTDIPAIKKLAEEFVSKPDEASLKKLSDQLKSKCQVLFSRMNMAPDGTKAIVSLRKDLLRFLPDNPELKVIDDDLKVLLTTWFNPGFLELRKIDWDTEASILEKIIRYETVHNIDNWNDLKQRLVENRRCFAYFHPALEDEPLIFVEVALTKGIASSVQTILNEKTGEIDKMDTAIFYSINNCQRGLRGIPLGNFLIKRVVAEINQEIPGIRKFSSLSPVPGFTKWLIKQTDLKKSQLPEIDKRMLMLLNKENWHEDERALKELKKPLIKACAHYLVHEKSRNRPANSVARFHFGNGADLFRINWMGNTSKNGLNESFGIMVNYRYDLKDIESNHEHYMREGKLALSKSVRNLLG
jgi:malonyl-CoA decarboxylase